MAGAPRAVRLAAGGDPVTTLHGEINFDLLAELYAKPHPLLNIADDFEKQIRETPLSWIGEVFQEARNVHHLLDLAGIAAGMGYASNVDARTYLAVTELGMLRDRLSRISTWHTRESGPAGMVGDFCNECGNRWPCDTSRMADGTYTDEEQP